MTKDTEITELDDQNESDYEIVEPEITLPEANDITVTGLPFTKFDQFPKIKVGSLINVIGVIISVDSTMKEITTKTGEGLKLKNFKISDLTKQEINCAIWGAQAESFSYLPGIVLKLETVKLTSYGGFSLSLLRNTIIEDITDKDLGSKLNDYWCKHYMNSFLNEN